MPPFIDLTGRRFGRLVVQERVIHPSRQPRWRCSCDCGTETTVFGNSLRSGATVSCGCYRDEVVTIHGKTGTPEFTVWQMMIQRCTNPRHASFSRYGGRGIVVCDRWRSSFADFLTDMGERPSDTHTLDRINNDGSYSPENCQWSTPAEQSRNKSNNRMLTIHGETLPLRECARKFGISRTTLRRHLDAGMDPEEAVFLVPRHYVSVSTPAEASKSTVKDSPELIEIEDP